MIKYLLLVILLAGCTQKTDPQKVLANLPQKLESAKSYRDYMEGHVEPIVQEILQAYSEDANQVCRVFARLSTKDLLAYNEVLEGVRDRIHCADQELKRIRGYYETFAERRAVSGNSRMATTVILLDKAYSLPKDKPLPAKTIALTFDDGPHAVNTPKVLQTLKMFQVDANFFMLGENANRYHTLVQDVANHGHPVGTHSMTHADLTKLSLAAAKKEIMGAFDVVEAILGDVNPFFRFPYGARTKALREFVATNNISDFFWDVDTLDWKYKDPDFLLKYAVDQTVQTGHGIVLFHDIQPQTAAVLPSYLDEISKLGYSTVVYHPSY